MVRGGVGLIVAPQLNRQVGLLPTEQNGRLPSPPDTVVQEHPTFVKVLGGFLGDAPTGDFLNLLKWAVMVLPGDTFRDGAKSSFTWEDLNGDELLLHSERSQLR